MSLEKGISPLPVRIPQTPTDLRSEMKYTAYISGIINPSRSFNCNCIRELEKITPKFQTGAALGPGRPKRVPEAGIEPARPLLAKGF